MAIDLAGRQLDKAPGTTLALGYTHEWTFGSGAALTARIATRYSSSYKLSNFATVTPIQYTQPAFKRTDVSISYTAPRDQ